LSEPRRLIALAGNPNSGKTTVFNALTGSRQHVGNYPGVTVERKQGVISLPSGKADLLDLPGTYGLTAYSEEERIAREVLLKEEVDLVVVVLDASNLERNLYLALQIAEMGLPMVLSLNMWDIARRRGMDIDAELLSGLMGVPAVPTVGSTGRGLEDLKRAIDGVLSERVSADPVSVRYRPDLEEALAELAGPLAEPGVGPRKARWRAVRLLETLDEEAGELPEGVEEAAERVAARLDGQPAMALIEDRYGFISGVCMKAIRSTVEKRHTLSDHIDSVVTSRLLGIPIFLGLMYLVFWTTFSLGSPMMGWLETGFEWMGGAAASLWPAGVESLLKSLLVDGVIGGVGGVLVFLPNILLLFLAIAILEDSGYMARAAFLMDRLMRRIGLQGKSFIPMLVGFGCTVPAIMSTRILSSRRDRLTTILVLPLISCGARLPIYLLIIPAFFPQARHARMLWIIYIVGILLAVAAAKLLRKLVFRGDSSPFVLELPPYRLPTLKGILVHMWQRAWLYLRKAGTIILAAAILMWALSTFPSPPEERLPDEPEAAHAMELRHSAAGRIGQFLEPALRPLGFDWRIGTAFIGSFAAKEVFVAQMGIIYSLGEADEESESLRKRLRERYSPLVGVSIMLFALISAPCMATIAVTRRETNSWGWALAQLGGLTLLAYAVTLIVYQAGTALGLG
jgi:ferrous iron transport protein B